MKDSQFSQREKEVIDLLIQGKSNKQIAFTLHIAESTVEYHLKNIYQKLDVRSRTEAVLRLGKSIGADSFGELRESIVETDRRVVDNDNKSLLLRRSPMNQKSVVIVGLFVLIVSLAAVAILQRMPAQATAITPTSVLMTTAAPDTATPTQPPTSTKRPTFTPQPTSTRPWDRYQPGTIGQIVSMTHGELTEASLGDKAYYFNYGIDYASEVVATYTGQFRPISERRRYLIGAWLTQIGKANAVNWFETEGLFVEDKTEYWLPIQSALIPLMKDELTEGKPAALFIIWIGATKSNNELDRVFLVNEFLATPRTIPTRSVESTPTPPPTVAEPATQPNVFTVEVHASKDWQDTGVTLKAYDKYEVKHISGTWSIHPPWGYVDRAGHSLAPHPFNPIPLAQPGELIGRIGQTIFRMGRQRLFLTLEDGNLFLRMNDDILTDNGGVLRLQITIQ